MELALECPTSIQESIQPLADFDFILTHLVLGDERYSQYYRRSSRFKILDNSCNELSYPCSLDEIERAADIVNPDFIMAPDFLGDHFSTINILGLAESKFGKDRIWPIVQGSEIRYAVECATWIFKAGYRRVAIPYDVACSRKSSLDDMATTRFKVVSLILTQVGIMDIHLLGMTTLEELVWYKTSVFSSFIKSIDTGSPVLHGLKGLKFGVDPLLPKDVPTLNSMPTNVSDLSLCYYNIAYLRKAMS